MDTTIERLQGLRVADVMSRDVVTLAANSTMAEAADVLAQYHISGAPVVDELEQCVGILSTTDFARRDQTKTPSDSLAASGSEYRLVRDEGAGPFQIEYVPENLVSQHMNRAPQTIAPSQSLIDATRYMHGEHIHRLVVVDATSRCVGVITSLDIIAALINAIDEQSSKDSCKT